MRKKVLIAGATGFIGRNLYEYFRFKENIELYCLNSSDIDFTDDSGVELYLRNNRYDVVIFCANYGVGRNPKNDASRVLEYNLRMVLSFERCSRYYGKLLYLGSGAEYDKRCDIINASEEDIGKSIPVDQYGLYKYTVNSIIRRSDNWYNLRLFGIFGRYEDWRVKFISNLCCKAIMDLPLTIRQNVYFDYLWIEDFCRIAEYFVHNDMLYRDYNVVSGKRIALSELASIVRAVSGKELPVYIGMAGYGKEYTADNSRLMNELKELEYTDIHASVKELYNWYESNRDLIDIYPLLYQ